MRRIVIALGLALAAAAVPACAQSPHLAEKLAKLAGSGNAEAQYHLGMLYNNGLGVEKDPRRAFALFQKAAAGGDSLGHYKVGCYYDGEFEGVVPPDPAEALRHKLFAAEAGYSLAQLDVAIHYYVANDYAAAFRWFEAAARQEEPQALYNLSVMYKAGLGTAASLPRAWAFFRLAHLASRGRIDPGAQASLDEMWAKLSASERVEAEKVPIGFFTGRTAFTEQALHGLDRAEALVRATPR
ncbi:MAG TPA: tetratricopeptide repeat protein [Allosphingosinicella sp.]|jgi:TPR repeat protein